MTDKELRKLSRLELLELLLEAEKENSRLKAEVSRFEIDNKTSQNIENLSAMIRQLEDSISKVNGLAGVLKNVPVSAVVTGCDKADRVRSEKDGAADVDIYKRLLVFFATNEEKTDMLPTDIAEDVRARINSLLDKRKSN